MSRPGTDSIQREILGLCARETGHDHQQSRLSVLLVEFERRKLDWESLVDEAEQHGIAPLLYRHCTEIGAGLPGSTTRMLQSLFLRCRRANTVRNSIIGEILPRFQQENIDVLLVKGIALCNFSYSEIGLRPMRDIDLLLRKSDLARAQQILLAQGYETEPGHNIPDNYYHLAPLRKMVDGLPVTIELHHNLLPLHAHYPLWPYEKSSPSAMEFDLHGTGMQTLGLEENLWYIYLHGFQPPLTYEPLRYVHIADTVNLVEKNLDAIDWGQAHALFPALPIFLSRIHFVTPWPAHVVDRLDLPIHDRPGRPGIAYGGWPQRRLNTVSKREWFTLLKDSLWPSQWWVQVYYGCLNRPAYLKARFFEHPRALWRWIKGYWSNYMQKRSRN